MQPKLPVNLVNLKYFCDAVKHESISASAKLNHVSQSAVSQGIAKLGHYFGFALLDHLPGKFRATQEGQKLYEAVAEVFQAMEKAEEILSKEGTKVVRFACTYSYALAFLPRFVKECKKKYPHLKLECEFGLPDEILPWVRKGKVDFAILLDNLDLSRFDLEEVNRGEYKLYCSKKYPLDETPQFLLDSDDRMETNLLKKSFRRAFRKPLPVLMELRSWEVAAAMAEQGLGVSLLPEYVADSKNYGLIEYPQDYFSMGYTIYALFPSGVISGWREELLSILRSLS